MLPFGLRSAPKIFNAIADGLQWTAMEQGVTNLDHFLDDFITTGHPRSNECSNNLVLLMDTCKLPLALSKLEGLSTCLVFLGIDQDTLLQQLQLPLSKLMRLKDTLSTWTSRKCCTKKELKSLIGLLHDAIIFIRASWTFIHHVIDLLKSSVALLH